MLFDVDGTLCDSDPLHLATFQEFLAERGFNGGTKIDEAFFREKIAGRHNPDIFRELFPQLSAAEQAALGEEKEALWRRMARGKLEPVAGLEDFLGWVDRQGLRKAAVTNAPRLNAECMFEALGLADYFDDVIIGAECARAKPFPDPYLRGLSSLGLRAEEALVLEDSPAGIRAAKGAGLAVVGLLTGQEAADLLAAGADVVRRDYRGLEGLLGPRGAGGEGG